MLKLARLILGLVLSGAAILPARGAPVTQYSTKVSQEDYKALEAFFGRFLATYKEGGESRGIEVLGENNVLTPSLIALKARFDEAYRRAPDDTGAVNSNDSDYFIGNWQDYANLSLTGVKVKGTDKNRKVLVSMKFKSVSSDKSVSKGEADYTMQKTASGWRVDDVDGYRKALESDIILLRKLTAEAASHHRRK